MKAFLLLGALALCLVGRAAVPAKVSGLVLTLTEFSPNSPLDATRHEVLLAPNGTYTGLLKSEYHQFVSLGGTGQVLISKLSAVSVPRDGTWSYRVLEAETAEMILDGRRFVLAFDDTPDGRIITLTGGLAGLFSFTEYNHTARLANVSTRAFVAAGRSVSVGFVVSEGHRRVLVRVVGPGLRAFGVTEPLEAPRLDVHRSGFSLPVTFDTAWSERAAVDSAAAHAGAFPLPAVGDRGTLLALPPGAYIAEVSSSDSRSSGEVLVEVYQLP